MDSSNKPPKVPVAAAALKDMVSQLFASAGMSTDEAAIVADVLVWANLRGVDSHGVSRVPRYLELFESGEANPRADVKASRVRPGLVLIDAGAAPGPVALCRAIDEGMSVARETGVAWVAVKGTVHTGAIGYYTERAASQGFAAIGMVAGMPNMAYTGSSVAGVATSPLSIAVPSQSHATPLLDMATAAIALGKIAQYKLAGKSLPEGSALTGDGQPTTDPAVAEIPLPMAGAKGAGLSLMLELLCGVLTDSPIVTEFHKGTPEGQRHRQNATFVVLDVAALLPLARAQQLVDETLDTIKQLPRSGDAEILYPGERGARTYAQRATQGIALPPAIWKKLVQDAEKRGVPVAPTLG
jgi:LDH2 family malate/lactate/ureidoglycolate dehydrogenase